MKLVKIGKIPGMVDISEQKVRELVRDGVWVEGREYYVYSALNYKLFDMEAIEKTIKSGDPVSNKVMALAERMVG